MITGKAPIARAEAANGAPFTHGEQSMSFARCLLCLAVGLGLAPGSASAQFAAERADPTADGLLVQAPKEPAKKQKDDFVGPLLPDVQVAGAQPERTDVSSLPRSRSPQFLGDFLGPYVTRGLTISPTITLTTPFGFTTTLPGLPAGLRFLVPDAFESTLKIAENGSPRPEDRVFLTYNYYQNVALPIENHGAFPIAFSALSTIGTGQIAFSRLDIHREVLGFEKTFADGDASVEVRLPLLEVDRGNPRLQAQSFVSSPFGSFSAATTIAGDNGIDGTDVGDLSLILKYALLNDRCTGDVVSVGMLTSLPTGEGVVDAANHTIRDMFLEPFLGFVWNEERFYVHGFSSVAVGLNSENPTFWFNDVGIGYWLYQDRCGTGLIHGIVPTFETHVNTPLSHRQSFVPQADSGPVVALDSVDLTVGAHLVFRHGSTLTVGASRSVTGPRLEDFEIIAQLNLRF
jgi:hypothetical protein